MATKRGIDPNTTIRLLKKKNPKTAGTQAFARFAAMMRVFEQTGHEALPFWRLTEVGYSVADARWDRERKLIEFDDKHHDTDE